MKRCHWVKPVMVCQIKFTEWTRDDRLRQPVFLGIREDKNAKEGPSLGQTRGQTRQKQFWRVRMPVERRRLRSGLHER